MVLFYLLQENININLHIIKMLKQFFCNRVRPTHPADWIFITLTLMMGALPFQLLNYECFTSCKFAFCMATLIPWPSNTRTARVYVCSYEKLVSICPNF